MILNIRGSSCSGKSHLVRQLLAEFPSSEVWERTGWNKTKPKQVGHLLPGGLLVIGPYPEGAKNGGLDVLQAGRTELVSLWLERNAVRYPYVLFESTAASLSIGRYRRMREHLDVQLGDENSVTFAFLDTPVEVCQARMMERGGDLSTVGTQWARVNQIRDRLSDLKENCLTIGCEDAYPQMITLLQTLGGWDPFSTPPITHPKVKTRYSLQDVWNEVTANPEAVLDPERRTQIQTEMKKHGEKFVP